MQLQISIDNFSSSTKLKNKNKNEGKINYSGKRQWTPEGKTNSY